MISVAVLCLGDTVLFAPTNSVRCVYFNSSSYIGESGFFCSIFTPDILAVSD